VTRTTPADPTDVRPAVFFDRDGTLIHDPGYLRDPADVKLLPGVIDALRRLKSAGYRLVVVSNQSGVARGLLTEEDVRAVNAKMQSLLGASDVALDGIYYCPYLAGDEAIRLEYRRDSDLRKPRPGMLLAAANDLGLILSKSWMVGDAQRDVLAGKAAGCRAILLTTDQSTEAGAADAVAPNLARAADIILSE
jgi:D-glycero-D-manno-heptose 1,7-bisphosphate phosphatase